MSQDRSEEKRSAIGREAGVLPARQARSEKSRDALLASLETLLRRKRFEDISVAEIASGAGLSVGAVYRRFANKDAFIPVLFEIYLRRLEAHFGRDGGVAVTGEDTLRATLREIARKSYAFLCAEAPVARAVHLYARLRPDLVGEEWEALIDASINGFENLVAHFRGEVKRADERRCAEYLAYHFNTAMIEKALYPQDGLGDVIAEDGDAFADAMADFAYGFLTTPEA